MELARAKRGLLAYGLISSRRAPDALHPYGYSRERFVWSLFSDVGIFCLGCGATIVHGVQNLATPEPLSNVLIAASVIAGSMVMEGASLYVAYGAVMKGAASEGMSLRDYLWRGHDATSVAVLMEFRKAVNNPDGSVLDRVLAEYVVSAVGCEVDRREKDIQRLVPGIRHVDIEAHNPSGPAPREKTSFAFRWKPWFRYLMNLSRL